MNMPISVVKERLRGSWYATLQAIVPTHTRLDGRHGPCPLPGCPDGGGKDRFRFDNQNEDGTWFCNHCGAGDGVELYRRLKGLSLPEALMNLAGGQNNVVQLPVRKSPHTPSPAKTELQPTIPAPEPKQGDLAHRSLGEPVGVWRYHTTDGHLMGFVCRYQGPDGKIITPWTHMNGKWVSKALPTPRPLYNLHLLTQRPKAPVLLVEGEKTADAAAKLWPDAVVTTCPNGAQAPKAANWEPLHNRLVVILPDADEPGLKFAKEVETILNGKSHVKHVILPPEIPITSSHGWDVADGGEHLETVVANIRELLKPQPEKKRLYLEGTIEDRAMAILGGVGRECGLYRMGDSLVRLARIRDQLEIQIMDAQRLQVFLMERFLFMGKNADGDWVSKTLPAQQCLYLLAKDLPFPALERVIRAPVYGKDGKLAFKDGYHENVSAFLDLGNITLNVSKSPEPWEKENALSLIQELFHDFPFQDEASYANAISMLFLPFVRYLIEDPTPLHLVSAPTPGTGKSMMVEAISIIATGQRPTIITEGGSDEEWRKRIMSTLLRSPAVICLDNINRKIDSGALASALTQRVIEDRLLGSTKNIVVGNDAVWTGTANNPTMTSEIARRVVWVRLVSNSERPSGLSNFLHSPLIPWVKENRGRLLWACLTLIQTWVVAGMPRGTKEMGSFSEWAGLMSGILEHVGIPGFMANADALFDAADVDSADWRDFVQKWAGVYEIREVGTADLFQIVDVNGFFDEHLGDGNERARKTKMGILLRGMTDRVFAGWRIVRCQGKNRVHSQRGGMVFRLEKMG